MIAFALELRNRRLLLWTILVTGLWVALPFLGFYERWNDTLYGVSIWSNVALYFAGPIIAAASADLTLERCRGTLPTVMSISVHRFTWINGVTWLARVTALLIVPMVITTVLLTTIALIQSPDQSSVWTYHLTTLAMGLALMGVGRAMAGLTGSRITAPILAFIFALALSQYIQVVPVTIKTWLMPNPAYVALFGVMVFALVVFGDLLLAVRRKKRERNSRVGAVVGSALALGVALSCVALMQVTPPEKLRPSPGDGACITTVKNNYVCAWVDDDHLLEEWVQLSERYENLIADVHGVNQKFTLTEPQLDLSDEGAQVIVVEPLEKGNDGAYMVSQSLAFSLIEDCTAMTSMTEDEDERLSFLTIAVLDAATSYMSKLPPPPFVADPNAPYFEQADIAVRELLTKSDAEQVDWIQQALVERNEMCTR